ncbi:dnaJ homolog subfamily C member 16 [Anthonomus grandis grandis]|uniref:dnaJ homolog subfamily C member 16 n=1 Tax=Anthonomus grandis grandis TaxID=2921223 RepID=UPI002165F64E|nr:dnaJ homolog subfamily C member 16 [Anthonomus grandis grandis]
MIWNVTRSLSLICFVFWLIIGVFGELGDPYSILGVHRRASSQEIKQAYRQLAKEWHPDKSKSTEAEERFVEIKSAYELLSDPERRSLYDKKGITEDDFYKRPEKHSYFTPSPFDDLFASSGGHFNFQENDITFFHKLSITTRQYDKVILPKSDKTPYLLFFYTDWCFPCLQSAPTCRKLNDNLEPLGINFVTVHSSREPNLSRRLNVHTLPCLVFLIDGNAYVYKHSVINIPKVIEFIKSKFPYKMVTRLKEDNLDEFLEGWTDNRVRGLILPHKIHMRLRYLVTAYQFRHRVAFGIADTETIHLKYQVPLDKDTVLLFNENVSFPMASITMKDIPSNTLYNIISSNQYLALPRLSSQKILDELCPPEWNKPRKRICVALVTEESAAHDPHRQTFREYALTFPYGTEKVRFAYMYHKRQASFIYALKPDGKYIEPVLRVLVFWRRDTSLVRYIWAPIKWELEGPLNHTHEKLAETIMKLLKNVENFPYEAYVTDLFDEHAIGFIKKLLNRVWMYLLSVYDSLGKEQILPVVSIFGTLVFIVAIGYLMSYLVEKEEENIRKKKAEDDKGNNNNTSNPNYQPELKLHELRSEKYNGLVRLLKPGCRTILLILDMQSRQQLIPPFHKAVWPYRKNKTLHFSFMYIERGLNWYKELLQMSLFEERELNINPRNCVGTVLALNGHRKYFCVFHAKHTEKKKKLTKSVEKTTEKDCESGAFIGFNSDTESEPEEVLLQGTLLDGLSNWLDRLFEGTTQRYHINYWPEFPIK